MRSYRVAGTACREDESRNWSTDLSPLQTRWHRLSRNVHAPRGCCCRRPVHHCSAPQRIEIRLDAGVCISKGGGLVPSPFPPIEDMASNRSNLDEAGAPIRNDIVCVIVRGPSCGTKDTAALKNKKGRRTAGSEQGSGRGRPHCCCDSCEESMSGLTPLEVANWIALYTAPGLCCAIAMVLSVSVADIRLYRE